jgi:PadR family transcriptional regulator PadR
MARYVRTLNERSQLLKGTLEGCILKVIEDAETYGYEISEKLKANGFSAVSEGTIYPLLLRLEKNGLVVATYRDSPLGPKRKYYSLTEKGRHALDEFYRNWCELQNCVNKLFSGYDG